jgi:hypothetical protein
MGGTSRACRLRLTCQTGTSACWPNNWSPRRWAGASRVASDGETRLEAVLTMEMDAGIRDVAWNGEAGLTTRPVVRAIVEIMIGRRFNVDCRVWAGCRSGVRRRRFRSATRGGAHRQRTPQPAAPCCYPRLLPIFA